PERPDIVAHVAQFENHQVGADDSQGLFNVNTISALRLLEYAKKSGAKKFILFSTGGTYEPSRDLITENSPLRAKDLNPYIASKLAGETAAASYASCLELIIFRPFFLYGPGQRQNMLIPRLVKSVAEGLPVKVPGKEGSRLNPLFVEDAAEATAAALSLSGTHTINLAGPETISIRGIAKIIGGLLGKTPIFEETAAPADDYVADIAKMKSLLRPPVVTAAEGLKKTITHC
nr:NAD(P)-dependent oxidoreductase [Elusimicrobiales bacterium]